MSRRGPTAGDPALPRVDADPPALRADGGDHADHDVLRRRIRAILDFYYPTCVDESAGGFVANLDEETGDLYDPETKHLVASARFVVNFSLATDLDGPDWAGEAAAEGLQFLQSAHRDEERGGYHWVLSGRDPVESERYCYGHAFVLLAAARAVEAGVPGAEDALEDAHAVLVDRFWEPEHDLFAASYDPDWETCEPYRGQNANMHSCEALIGAYEATGDDAYLDRALSVARSLTVRLADEADGRIWEHYTPEWDHDFAYNRDQPTHQFRPWGYQPGHHVEWAKLLATLDRHADAPWLLDRAEELWADAVEMGWDDDHGGFVYAVAPEGDVVVPDTYGWTVAEGIGAAAALFERTGADDYREWYDRLWEYATAHFVAPHGNWYERLTRENERVPYEGTNVEPGYHPIGACVEGLRSL